MSGPGHQHRRPAAGGSDEALVSAPAAETEPHLAPGGGNALMTGAIGGLDSGVRQLAGGGTEYGSDTAQHGLLGSLFALDRVFARAELESRFEVVDDNFVGPRLPHQVTSAELDRIATLYSDIRTGSSNVRLGTDGMSEADATSFRAGAMNDIATMLTTEQGRALLDDLAYQQVDGRDVTTTIGQAASPGEAGAFIQPTANPEHAVDGTGTASGVNYVPGHTVDMAVDLANPNYETSPWRHMTSDIVLFHELVHANRSRLGITEATWDPAAGQFDRPAIENSEARSRYDRGAAIEEYATVGLAGYGDDYTENAYRAERSLVTGTRIPQRDTYNGSGPARRRRR